MNATLFFREIKANYKMFLIFLAVIAMYIAVVVAMFDPKLGDSMAEMAKAMPQMFAAFGMDEVGTTLLEFSVNYLYGFLLLALPGVFLIILGNRLIARYVDGGSMAYLLASPNTRKTIVRTQMKFMIFSIFLMVVLSAAILYGCAEVMFPGELEIGKFLLVNVGLFGVLLFLGGIAFCCSCIFSDTKWSLGVSAALLTAFLLLQMLADMGEQFDFLRYATPLTLFDTQGIMAGEASAMGMFVLLYVAGMALYFIGMAVFCRKDLSL